MTTAQQKTALITGQDGSYLAEFLLKKGYIVHGIKRRASSFNTQRVDHIYLYRNADEVLAQLIEAGFSLEQSFVGAAYKPSAPGVPMPQAAAFIVF